MYRSMATPWVGHWRIRRVPYAHRLRVQQFRSFVLRTTDSDPAVRTAPNRLLGQPEARAAQSSLGWRQRVFALPRPVAAT